MTKPVVSERSMIDGRCCTPQTSNMVNNSETAGSPRVLIDIYAAFWSNFLTASISPMLSKGLFTTKSTFYTSDFQCLGKKVVSRPSCQTAKPPTSSAFPNRQTSVPFLPKSQALCQATTIPPPSWCRHLLAATSPHKSSLPTFSHTFTTKNNLTHPKTNHLSSKQPQHVSLRHPFIHRTYSRCFSREIVSFPLLPVSGTSPTNHHEQH